MAPNVATLRKSSRSLSRYPSGKATPSPPPKKRYQRISHCVFSCRSPGIDPCKAFIEAGRRQAGEAQAHEGSKTFASNKYQISGYRCGFIVLELSLLQEKWTCDFIRDILQDRLTPCKTKDWLTKRCTKSPLSRLCLSRRTDHPAMHGAVLAVQINLAC